MNLRRLSRTTAIRLALRYAVYYALLTAFGLGAIYWATSRYVDAQLATGLEQELETLIQIDTDQGSEALAAIITTENNRGVKNHRYYLLADAAGNRIAGNVSQWPHDAMTNRKAHNIWIEDDWISDDLGEDAGYWPVVGASLANDNRLLIAQRIDITEDLQEFILSVMGLILILTITLALTMGLLLGRTILRKIDGINLTAQAIVTGDLNQRIPLSKKNDEFDELARNLNAMLLRIEQLIIGMREVTDNVAHDLRSPLSRLRNRLEITLLESRNEKEYIHVIQQTIEDADGLIHTFNALLEIAQVEAGNYRGTWGNVDLTSLTIKLGELYQDQAEESEQLFSLEISPDINVAGSYHLLAQAVSNLLENAIKYTPKGGHIKLSLTTLGTRPQLIISDNGPGIPAKQRAIVLERFTRLDSARNTSGCGLGLSLVKVAAALHHAELELSDNAPGLRIKLLFTAPA